MYDPPTTKSPSPPSSMTMSDVTSFGLQSEASYGTALIITSKRSVDVTMTNCIFDGNLQTGSGQLFSLESNSGTLTISNCIYANLISTGSIKGGVYNL